jgi:hypothetical protein
VRYVKRSCSLSNQRADNDELFPLDPVEFFGRSKFNQFELTENTSVYVHRFGHGFQMPWHQDTAYINQATIYLNQHWNESWGGLFQTEDVIHVPNHNCGVVKGVDAVPHAITPITTDQPRLSVQIMQLEVK